MLSVPISFAAGGVTHLVSAPAAGFRIRVYGYVLTAGAAVSATLQDTAATALTGAMPLGLGPVVAPCPPVTLGGQLGWFDLAPGLGLDLNTSGAVQVSGHLAYDIIR